MLPKHVYEIQPYGCIGIAFLFFGLPSSPRQMLSAALMFLAGCEAWMLRSKQRRPDRVTASFNPSSLLPFHKRFILLHSRA